MYLCFSLNCILKEQAQDQQQFMWNFLLATFFGKKCNNLADMTTSCLPVSFDWLLLHMCSHRYEGRISKEQDLAAGTPFPLPLRPTFVGTPAMQASVLRPFGVHLQKFTLPTQVEFKQHNKQSLRWESNFQTNCPHNFHCIAAYIEFKYLTIPGKSVTSKKACPDDCERVEYILFPVFITSNKSSDKQMKFMWLNVKAIRDIPTHYCC